MSSVCPLCKKSFSRKAAVIRHCLKIHKVCVSTGNLSCDICKRKFGNFLKLRTHYTNQHGYVDKLQLLEFSTAQDFENWKAEEEEKMRAHFVMQTGAKKLSGENVRAYFRCNRSGTFKSRGTGKRQLKSQGSSKIGHFCLSSMVVTKSSCGKVSVEYHSEHYGHTFNIAHLILSAKDKFVIAGKLASGVPLQTVLDDIRDTASGEISRLHKLTKSDLHNIIAAFNINPSGKLHDDDKISVETWIRTMKSNEESPVLFFKQRGERDLLYNLEDGDCMLVLMSQPQKDMVEKLRSDKICIDSIDRTNAYPFNLATLVVIDEFGNAFPCAFCISNKLDSSRMTLFFQKVKNVVGRIECKIFMSDGMPAFFNAWKCVMTEPCHEHLTCSWHVDKNWRDNINKLIPDKELKALVYKSLCALLGAKDLGEFPILIDTFLSKMEEEKNLWPFKQYFEANYAYQKTWAYCHHQYLGIHTNTHLESLHHSIKLCYLEGKVNKRVDRLISMLLKLTRDTLFDRLMEVCKEESIYRISKINKSHELGNQIPRNHVTDVISINSIPKKWKVKSQSTDQLSYFVQRVEDHQEQNMICNDSCNLLCKVCKVCIHKFICSCPDHVVHFNICKHIHAVLHYNHIDSPVLMPANDPVQESHEQDHLLQKIQTSGTHTMVDRNEVLFLAKSMTRCLETCSLDVDQLSQIKFHLSKVLELTHSEKRKRSEGILCPSNKKIAIPRLPQRIPPTTIKPTNITSSISKLTPK